MDIPLIPVSVGELYDKYSILEIKLDKITDNLKSTYLNKEYDLLTPIIKKYELNRNIYIMLKEANLVLWNTEDKLREKEALGVFDQEFIELSRSVYRNNDLRSEIKNTINKICDSQLNEIKSYTNYQNQ